MRLAAALQPLALDAKQALRLRPFSFAVFNYVIATVLAGTAWAFDELSASDVKIIVALIYRAKQAGNTFLPCVA